MQVDIITVSVAFAKSTPRWVTIRPTADSLWHPHKWFRHQR